jgi:D-xylose 1-dehydrogenase (NADP+, D-xylono-1,5-lactone-forming)
MPDRIRWGILSTARIAYNRILPAMSSATNSVVAGVASRSLETAQAFAQKYGVPRAFGSYEEMLASPDIDAIYIPLPNSLHAEWSIKCAEAGKPTLCEKPLASNAAEAQIMVDAFAAHGVLFAEAFMWRFHPRHQRVLAMLRDGAIGDLHMLSAAFCFALGDDQNIRLKADLAGGALMDVGCYCVNTMRLMSGEEPSRGYSLAKNGAEVDETLTGILEFPSGALGHFDCGMRTHRAHWYELRGSRGRILVEDAYVPNADETTYIRWWQGERYEVIEIPPSNQYTIMLEDFADALIQGRSPRFPAQDGVDNMRVIDMLYGRK